MCEQFIQAKKTFLTHALKTQGSVIEARMEEMRQAIERGRGIVPRSASPAFFNSTLDMDHLKNLVADTECDIKRVHQNHQALQAELKLIAADALDVCCARLVHERVK